MALVLLLHLPC